MTTLYLEAARAGAALTLAARSFLLEVESASQRARRLVLRSRELLARPFPRPDPRLPSVLVVDDDPSIRAMLRCRLEQAGYSVTEAADGGEALLSLARKLPALVVLDLDMAPVGGAEFRRRQLQCAAWAAVPVVLHSAAGDLAELAAALRVQAHCPKGGDVLAQVRLVLARAGAGRIP